MSRHTAYHVSGDAPVDPPLPPPSEAGAITYGRAIGAIKLGQRFANAFFVALIAGIESVFAPGATGRR